MGNNMTSSEMDVPVWDVALENLAREELQKLKRPLTLDDFSRLANEYTIRLDDIMATLFELVIQGEWCYEGKQKISRELLDDLYIGGRLHTKDLESFSGKWSLVAE